MTQAYKIIEENKHEVYERGETCVFDIDIRAIPEGTKTVMSDVSLTVTDPCGTVLLNEQSMASDGTGEYVYRYTLPASAVYGQYDVTYEATDTSGYVTKKRNTLFIFRFDLINKIRSYSGVTKESVNDEDIAKIAMDATRECLEEVYEFHKDEKPTCDPDYGVMFNGTNKVVRTRCGRIADYDFNGSVQGYGANPCTGDISGYWYDSDYARHDAKIVVNDSISGRITLTQDDDSAIPNNHKGVYITYHTEWESFNEKILEDAIAYLASHHLILRMTDLHRATAADLEINEKKLELNLNRFKHKYEILIEKISRPRCDGI